MVAFVFPIRPNFKLDLSPKMAASGDTTAYVNVVSLIS